MNATQHESNSMNRLYIALVRAEVFSTPQVWPSGLALYYDPGSVSMGTHETLSYCFLQRGMWHEPVVWSRDDVHLTRDQAAQALKTIDQERHRLDANLPSDWPDAVRPEMRAITQTLYRLHYFEPNQRFIGAMLKIVQGGRVLTPAQLATIKQIKEERGTVTALRRRQHTQWRLRKLAALDLPHDDRVFVEAFLERADSPAGLKPAQRAVIGALEEKYLKQRVIQTIERAEQIMAELQMEAKR